MKRSSGAINHAADFSDSEEPLDHCKRLKEKPKTRPITLDTLEDVYSEAMIFDSETISKA